MITVLNKTEFPAIERSITIPPKVCGCKRSTTVCPAGAKWNADTGVAGGFFWDCPNCRRNTLTLLWAEAPEELRQEGRLALAAMEAEAA